MIRRLTMTTGMAAALLLTAAPAFAEGDAANGEGLFRRCSACHSLDAGSHRVGPSLHGVVGRVAGSAEGYRYSDGLAAAGEGGLVWDEESISAYVENPTNYIREAIGDSSARSKMTFRLPGEDDRADIAAYLATIGD